MYSRIAIKNFRGIGSLEVEGLRRINLIDGRNNSDKTTFLESLFLLGGGNDPRYTTTLGRLRGQRLEEGYPDQVWRFLFTTWTRSRARKSRVIGPRNRATGL